MVCSCHCDEFGKVFGVDILASDANCLGGKGFFITDADAAWVEIEFGDFCREVWITIAFMGYGFVDAVQ